MHGQEGLVSSLVSKEIERWSDAVRPPRHSPPVREAMLPNIPENQRQGRTWCKGTGLVWLTMALSKKKTRLELRLKLKLELKLKRELRTKSKA